MKQGDEGEQTNTEALLRKLGEEVAEGDKVTITTRNGVMRGLAVDTLGGGSGLTIEIQEPNRQYKTHVEITLRSMYQSSGKFVYKIWREQEGGTFKVDETPVVGQEMLLGGDRVSSLLLDVQIVKGEPTS